MPVITITTVKPTTSISPPSIPTLQTLLTSSPAQHTFGTKTQSPSTIQITSTWPAFPSPSALTSSPAYTSFLSLLAPFTPTYLLTTLSSTLSTSPLTEFVQCDFPLSTSQSAIESDFARFETAFRQRGAMEGLGEVFLATGWSEEWVDSEGAKVRSWVVARGWEGMEWFERAVGTEEFGGAVGILTGWGVPFELWHVETKGEVEGKGE